MFAYGHRPQANNLHVKVAPLFRRAGGNPLGKKGFRPPLGEEGEEAIIYFYTLDEEGNVSFIAGNSSKA